MKKILALMSLITLLGIGRLDAQVSVNVNIGGPPAWGPYGYNDARFYFIPDIDVYYDVWYGNYYYYDYGQWVCRPSLPPRYVNFNLYGCYKVVLDYRGSHPYRYWNNHRVTYAGYRNYSGPRQYTYRDRGYANGYSRGYNRGYDRGYNRGNNGGAHYKAAPAPAPARQHRIEQGSNRPTYNRGGGDQGGRRQMPANKGGNRGGGGQRGGGGHQQHGGGGGGHGGGHGHHR